jgi:hypothetical protein
MKLPAIQLYPGDWLKDDIAGCSIAAQGLWLRMMFVMHESERYGHLQKNSSPIPPEAVARRCGVTLEQYDALLSELSRAGVPSINDDGILYSRRMVRDASLRNANTKRQQKYRASSGCKRNGSNDIGNRNASVTPLSQHSSSSSSTSSPPLPPVGGEGERARVWVERLKKRQEVQA